MTEGTKPPPDSRGRGTMRRSYTPLGLVIPKPTAGQEAVVLVVDGDAVSRRFVEIALLNRSAQAELSIAVEAAKDASSALAILKNTLIDLLIVDGDLPDMSGLEFLRRLQRESRHGAIPVLFFSAETKVKTKALAFASGAEDYLQKPCDPVELRVRVEAMLSRRRATRAAAVKRGYVLAGDFSAIPFPDLVGILGMGQRTGVISVATRRAVGRVFCATGAVVHAQYGNLLGEEAFYAILGEDSGKFEFTPTTLATARAEVTIQRSLTELIMEGARLIDTRRAARGPIVVRPDHVIEPVVTPMRTEIRPAPARSPQLAAQFANGLVDPFVLGEPYLFTADDLAKWTRASGGLDRLHVLLLADPAAGVSALLPLASEPNERWVLGALSTDPKAMGLAFFLRHDRVLDVVMLDVRNAGSFVRELKRTPSIVMVAPPEGDFLEIGTRALVEIDSLVNQLRPTLVVGVGDAAVEPNLRAMSSIRAGGIEVRGVSGALGAGRIDLRAVLLEALRAWGSPAAPPAINTNGFGQRSRA